MDLDVIYNEDCYKGIKKIPDKSIDLVYIDIPYLIGNGGQKEKKSNLAKRIQKEDKQISNIKTGIDFSIFDELCRVMKNIYIYIWCSKEQLYDIMTYFVKKGCIMNELVWCKTNPTPATNGNWLPDIEYCLVFKGNNAPRYNDGYELKSKWYVSPINKSDKDLFYHPTIKPLELVKRHILHSTKENDVVLDCFMGSGTTAVACKELNRHYIGFEINTEYYQIALDRLNGLTKKDREKRESGQMSLF